jgi:hypothetical protein
MAELVIPAGNLVRLRPRPARSASKDPLYDRQARLFGDLGQECLQRLYVAVVGLGGVGSILVEFLARLGVGHLVLIDDDPVDLVPSGARADGGFEVALVDEGGEYRLGLSEVWSVPVESCGPVRGLRSYEGPASSRRAVVGGDAGAGSR